MLDWHALEVFISAAHYENFSAAAQELNLSQPAVTQRIQLLERQLGVELFERQGRRVFLSEAGAYMLPLAEDLMRRSKRLEEMMHSLSGEVVGHLVLGCSTTSGKYILPSLLARFCEQYPGVRATVKVGSRASALEMLRTRGVQIAFSSVPIEHREITYRRFLEDDVILIVPIHHPWTQLDSIKPGDLLGESLILRESSSGTYRAMEQALGQYDIMANELRTVMTLGNSEAIIMAVEEGIGVGFVTRISAQRSLETEHVREIPIEGVEMKHTIWMAESTLHPATVPQIRFLDMLKQEQPLASFAGDYVLSPTDIQDGICVSVN